MARRNRGNDTQKISRREFIRDTGLVVCGAALGSTVSLVNVSASGNQAETKPAPKPAETKKRITSAAKVRSSDTTAPCEIIEPAAVEQLSAQVAAGLEGMDMTFDRLAEPMHELEKSFKEQFASNQSCLGL